MSIAIKRLERAISDLPKGGMQTGSYKVKLDLADAERLIVELNALQAERDALAAQLAAIQDAALKPRGRTRQQWIDNIKRNVFGVRAVEHLLELKSEAGRAGFIAAYNENKFIMLYEKNIERRADDYAEKIKAGRL